MRSLVSAGICAALTLTSLQACAQAPVRPLDMTPEQVQDRFDWVTEVENQDFQFWRRMRDQPDNTAFRQTQDWYSPMVPRRRRPASVLPPPR